MIDGYLLRYFLAVVDHGNFSRAATHCRVSQPTLSIGIAKLEATLGRPLFERTSRRVELTPAGVRFVGHARRIEAEFAEAQRSVRDDPPALLIRIGIVGTLPAAWIEQAVAAARQIRVEERIEIVEDRMSDLLRKLERGRIDTILGPLSDDCNGRTLFTESYAMAVSASHKLAMRAAITAEDVAADPMIVRRQCEALPAISRFFTERGIRPFMAARTMNDDRAIAYVRSGLGVTVMPRCFAADGLALISLAGFDVSRRIGFRTPTGGAGRLGASAAFDRFERELLILAQNAALS